jgi:TolB-like protein
LSKDNVPGPKSWSIASQQAVQEILSSHRLRDGLADKSAIAVVPLSSEGKGTTQLGVMLANGMESALLESGRFRVADRRTLDVVLNEKDLAMALAQDHIAELGHALSADALLVGSVALTDDKIVGEIRLVAVKKAEVLATSTFTLPADEETRSLMLYVQRPVEKVGQQAALPPISLYYDILAQRQKRAGQFEEIVVNEKSVLCSGDQYRIRVHPGSDCYLYVITYDSQGDVYVLFPHAKIKQGNYIRGGCTYTIPGQNDPWYTLDDNPGKETLVFVASYEPLRDLDKLLSTMKTAGAVEKDKRESVRKEIAKVSQTRGQEDCYAEGFKVSNIRGTNLEAPKADYVLGDGRSIENLMRVAEGLDRVVQMTTFEHAK